MPIAPVERQDLSDSYAPKSTVVAWDAYRVHVESGFTVERREANGDWDVVATHDPLPLGRAAPNLLFPNAPLQQASSLLTDQDPGIQYYRIVSLTRAPLQNRVAVSGEIEVDVQAPPAPLLPCPAPGPNPRSIDPGDPASTDCRLSAPANLRVTNVTGTSATLSWDDVSQATGYKVRLDGIAYTTEALGDVNSHVFNNLRSGTAHVLEVASSTAAGDSAFASLTLLVPPTIATPTTTSSSITVTWGEVRGATGYDLKRLASGSTCDASGVDADTKLLTYTFNQGLSASTDYKICVRASNAQGESAWAFGTARTKALPPPEPPKVWDPPSLNCLTSLNTGEHIAWRSCCLSTSAVTLLGWLGDSVGGVLKWTGAQWLRYSVVDGQEVPGSINFTISAGNVLWLSAAASSRADGTWLPPPPTAAELKRLAELAAQ